MKLKKNKRFSSVIQELHFTSLPTIDFLSEKFTANERKKIIKRWMNRLEFEQISNDFNIGKHFHMYANM